MEDGVYYADIELMNATREAASMGNTALRGSSSYEAKQTGDTDYRPLIVVKDGKATAILEYMPMGYLMFYGFLLELNSVNTIAETEETLSNVWPSQNIEVSTGMPPVPVLSLKQFTDEENAAMAAKLIEAINALEEKGDKSSLDALIAEAETKEETAYTPNSWNAFQEKLTAAKEVQNNQDAGVTQVTAAVNELTAAMEGLIARADLSSLNQLLDEVGELQESAYTEESWRALQTAITEAKEAAADPNVSQNTIDTLRTAS